MHIFVIYGTPGVPYAGGYGTPGVVKGVPVNDIYLISFDYSVGILMRFIYVSLDFNPINMI